MLGPVLVMERSAPGRTTRSAVSVVGVSAVSESAVAVLVTVAPSSDMSGRARTVTVTVLLAAMVPSAQVRMVVPPAPGAAEQLPWVAVEVSYTSPAGRVSTNVVPVDADGPSLRTSMRKSALSPTLTVPSSDALLMVRLELAVCPPSTSDALLMSAGLAGSLGSPPLPSVMTARLVTGLPGAHVAVTVMGGYEAPAARASERVHCSGVRPHDHPVPLALTDPAPAARKSVTVTRPVVFTEPLLLTSMLNV